MTELIKLAEMAGVMHEADHAYFIWSTSQLHRLATDASFIACNFSCHVLLPITWIRQFLF